MHDYAEQVATIFFGVLGGLNDKVILDKIMSHL